MDFSAPLILENSRVRLRSLEASDFADLKAVAFDPELWQYTLTAAHTPVELAAYLRQALLGREQGKRYPFVIIDRHTGQVAGSTSYYNVDLAEQRLSIGYTWVGREFQRSGLNRACKHLLLSHAFGSLGCERVELETDSRNWKSREAMSRMGATEEGTLRSHRNTQGGSRRDTVIFSILKPEWDSLRQSVFKEFDARGFSLAS
jgi:RimJ/RimL family protein N-acetyltransferase